MTLQIYAKRKEMALAGVEVEVSGERTDAGLAIHRKIRLEGNLTDEQRTRLLEIASKCPVHKSLTGKITVESRLA